MDYSQMLTQVEDSEITIRIGELFGWNAYFIHPDGSVTFRDDRGRLKGKKNYCNKAADAWPIITGNHISLMHDESLGKWCAGKPYWVDGCEWQLDIDVIDENPLRAAMIVFLMMQDAKHA
ncbi:TPA: phage protein NinX family protein [Enterobacter hormaechei]